MKWVAFLFISVLFAGCAVKNHDFPVHLEQTKRAARSYLGKPFLTYLELNPEIRSHVPDGQGGHVYTVVVSAPSPGWGFGVIVSVDTSARYLIRFYVGSDGLVQKIFFQTEVTSVSSSGHVSTALSEGEFL